MRVPLNLLQSADRLSSFARELSGAGPRSAAAGSTTTPPRADSSLGVPPWYVEARQHLRRHAWARAQRVLEQTDHHGPSDPAGLDLASIRAVRRLIRRTAYWPSDVEAHLDLGRAYFDLDLADEALTEFNLAQRLAPNRYEPFVLAALEYLYRGEYTRALGAWLQARDRNPELPNLDDVLVDLPQRVG
jgi:tetratricopeptide (TPR) repeat protein